jgi:hypothetical protein
VFGYVYAVLHARGYRSRYAELLRSGFARVPLHCRGPLFLELGRLGLEMARTHLLEGPAAEEARATFHHQGDRQITHVGDRGKPCAGRVDINTTAYFDGVSTASWEHTIGGTRVLRKWLEERRGRALLDDDVEHFRRVVAAMDETIRITARIDAVIEDHGGWPLAFPPLETR